MLELLRTKQVHMLNITRITVLGEEESTRMFCETPR